MTIDDFVDEKLAEAKLALSPMADPRTPIRRMFYDLTGLPPDAQDVEAFVRECTSGSSFALRHCSRSSSASSPRHNTACNGAAIGWMSCAIPIRRARTPTDRSCMRGDPEKLGDEVPRRWLSILGGESVPADAGSGRKELGDWIVRSPLAARVMVNRIWEWHFGNGLVRFSNDFGARGEKPTHPKQPDWLAAEFVESSFSVKAIHRLIFSSKVYQCASAAPAAADPDNRLLAHFSRRRLTAEEMRDSLFTASGQLNRTPAQAHPFPAEATRKFTQHNPFNAIYETDKRSAYLMVQRQRRHPFLSLFDGADPNVTTAARQTTTVPTQALYFINDPFFHAQADALANKLISLTNDDTRITDARRILLQRKPTAAEIQRTKAFLDSYPSGSADK